jgi:hypothetical protein
VIKTSGTYPNVNELAILLMFTCCLPPEHVNSIQIHIILIKVRNFTTKEMISISKLPKTGDELRCSGRVGSSCSTSGTRRVNLVTNQVTSHKQKRSESDKDKWNISVVICNTDIP